MYILVILSHLGYSFYLSRKLNISVDTVPFLLNNCIIIALYVVTFSTGQLQLASYAIFFIGLFLFIWIMVLTKKGGLNDIHYYFTPGIVIYCLFLIVIWNCVYKDAFQSNDEFSQWGLISKIMFISNNFSKIPEITFTDYPPGRLCVFCS